MDLSKTQLGNCYAGVVYFDQRLAAAHSKCWSKYNFHLFCTRKLKKRKIVAKFSKKVFFEIEPECLPKVFLWEKNPQAAFG